MFLVNAVTLHDNLPLAIFPNHESALAFAKTHDGEIPESVLEMFSIDSDGPLGIERHLYT